MAQSRVVPGGSVDKALWFIESHFARAITLAEIANVSGLSRWELSRVFRAATGRTLSDYLRSRRLSEAARMLAAGEERVAAVALACGYGSHEAFTRAFRLEFGTPPAQLRDPGALDGLRLTGPVRGAGHDVPPILSYRFENVPRLKLEGVQATLAAGDPAGIPAVWQAFHATVGQGETDDPYVAYGVVALGAATQGGFSYFAGREMDRDVSPDAATMVLPAFRGAVFAHSGHVSLLPGTVAAVRERWVAHQGLTPAPYPYFIERYSADFDPWRGVGGIEVIVPMAG